MVIWIPKGEFPHWQEEFDAGWKGSNILAYQTEVRQERIIHFENLYRYMYHYLTEEGWKAPDGSPHIEPFYGETRGQDGSKEIRVWWRTEKSWAGGPGGGHYFFKFQFYVDILAAKMKRMELMYKGKKVRPYMGDVTMWFAAIVVIDKGNLGSQKGWGGQLYGLLEEYWIRRIYKKNITDQEVELRRFASRYVDDVKAFIDLTRGSEVRELWFKDKQFAF